MSERNCIDCGKPLGGTIEKCHDCGGVGRRGGKAIAPHQWQIMLGIEPMDLKPLDFASRNIDNEEHHAHHAAGTVDE